MAQYGLLGEKLPHSYSPQIHSMLGEYGYQLFEVATDQLENFLRSEKLSMKLLQKPGKSPAQSLQPEAVL